MRKVILVLALGLSLTGCVLLEKFDNCDAACEAQAQHNADIAKTVVNVGYPAAGGAVAIAVYTLSRAILGKRKKKEGA